MHMDVCVNIGENYDRITKESQTQTDNDIVADIGSKPSRHRHSFNHRQDSCMRTIPQTTAIDTCMFMDNHHTKRTLKNN
eukprot:m.1610677 g.1610677  ORF g.1610677 m.1610677 type:complete len:79 (+) comp25366_c0_seq76:2335-2571(+)